MKKIKKSTLFLLILLGMILSIKLVIIYFNTNFNPNAVSSFCTINNYIDCDGVAKTSHSRAFGIPLALWGVILYSIFFFFFFIDKINKISIFKYFELFKNPYSYISALGTISFVLSMVLAFISIFDINKICILCFATYFINLFIAIVSETKGQGLFYDIRISIKDFIDAIKKPKYLIPFILCSLLATSLLAATSYYKPFEPKKPATSLDVFRNMKKNPFKATGNILGDKNAKVIVHSYTDYYCPFCRIVNLMLYKTVTDLNSVRIIHHEFPLDSACNPLLKQHNMHPNACLLARYSIAAKKQNKAIDMNIALFDLLPKNENEILKIAKKIGLDIKKLQADANSEEVKHTLKREIQAAIDMQINSTPTIIINSNRYIGVSSYEGLKKLLLDAGAEEK